MITDKNVLEALEIVKKRNFSEIEFLQAVTEVFDSIQPAIQRKPEYVKQKILKRIAEPERTIVFRVPWQDDQGEYHVNRGIRVEMNSAIGPYKGGLRFRSTVYIGIL